MRPALLDEAPLETPVVVGVERLLGAHRVEVGAPAAPNTLLCRCASPANPSQVSGLSALTMYSLIRSSDPAATA